MHGEEGAKITVFATNNQGGGRKSGGLETVLLGARKLVIGGLENRRHGCFKEQLRQVDLYSGFYH